MHQDAGEAEGQAGSVEEDHGEHEVGSGGRAAQPHNFNGGRCFTSDQRRRYSPRLATAAVVCVWVDCVHTLLKHEPNLRRGLSAL